tara:strand:- start:77 stop:250 length:174 start_codon:yes stop_codon:yes gene_type:complete
MSDENNDIKDLSCKEMKDILNDCKNENDECEEFSKIFKEMCVSNNNNDLEIKKEETN